ncbi:MAG: ABC transporter permease subunit [Tissierellia bacterium]|nr:ABC transporter permease subunit [Tissierellia bacterium]
MPIFSHELRISKKSFMIWAIILSAFILLMMVMYPQMQTDMKNLSDSFSNMGAFTKAFSLDKLDFSTSIGFYAIEAGNILLIGTSLFAALIAIQVLSKEEGNETAEFLYSHPISRKKVYLEKVLAIFAQILLLHIILFLVGILSFKVIGESVDFEKLSLLHLTAFIMNIQIASICIMVSAFSGTNSFGLGLGIALILYFLNIAINITDILEPARWLTPFAYTEAATIINDGSIELALIGVGMLISLISLIIGLIVYDRKDLRL